MPYLFVLSRLMILAISLLISNFDCLSCLNFPGIVFTLMISFESLIVEIWQKKTSLTSISPMNEYIK